MVVMIHYDPSPPQDYRLYKEVQTLYEVTIELVALCERLSSSLTVFHKGRQLRSSRAGQKHLDFSYFNLI